MTEKLIQTGAFALWQADAIRATGKPRREAWDDVSNDEKARWAATFCAAQSLLESAGYAVVPVEPERKL